MTPDTGGSTRSRILVTGVGGPSGQSIMKSLAQLSPPVDIIAADLDPYAAGLYLVPEGQRFLLPRGDDPGFTDALLALSRRERADVVLPTVDSELLPVSERRADFAAAGAAVIVASPDTLRMCLDKWALHVACEGEVRVPSSVILDADFDPASVPLPVIVKPRTGSGSRGIHLVKDVETLAAFEPDGTNLVQEHLPGEEFSLDVIARADGHVLGVVPRERLKVDSGIAITGRTIRDDALETYGRRVAELIGLTTVANVQVKRAADGTWALLEVNARFPGTMPLTIAAGIDMPALAVREALGEVLPDGPLPFQEIGMVRYMTELFLPFTEIQDMQGTAP
jgi:carbamoyl-phosphate synthase large subunit